MGASIARIGTAWVGGGAGEIEAGGPFPLEAKALGNRLVVILNNDNWLLKKKGYVFMPELERKEMIEAFGCVDEVVLTKHEKSTDDMSVCAALEEIKPNIFANGGDRQASNIPEGATCEKIGCELVFNVGSGGKVQSSSWLVEKLREQQKLKGSL